MEMMMSEDILWCCHVRGPDDVLAAPDYETALMWADRINEVGGDLARKMDILYSAVPAPWPHSKDSHQYDLLNKSSEYAWVF